MAYTPGENAMGAPPLQTLINTANINTANYKRICLKAYMVVNFGGIYSRRECHGCTPVTNSNKHS